ncbi:hypothetical protein [Propionibacterium freudenreichii]|uniref:Uncharacterized protein n=2 Tax=Propionibacterium freudenreichii TaxID=1744 RepID=A0A2C7AU18_9ACTN|nr:hypothetical protein [Propionibacterium freudenreichii]SCQ75661.1 Hypothetical protein PFR_JS20-1_1844 [Propionibacterium freudenreichii]SCQ83011.1 Hypothetical protein PFR_JS20-2_1851 [Propionibacterium freudenreichii]SPB30070.1 hypothetical protein MAJHIDBO_00365 [Propionibacterium freudenreichii subsp. shermanii]SPS08178.1 hypothetical protein MAJHIDBO_00365 [Propionibacterium freudenreichii subsp. shermanii]
MGTIVSFLVVGGLILWVLVDIHQNAKEEKAKKARIQAREDKLEARADAEYEYQQALRLAELRLLEQQRINEALASPDDLDAILAQLERDAALDQAMGTEAMLNDGVAPASRSASPQRRREAASLRCAKCGQARCSHVWR